MKWLKSTGIQTYTVQGRTIPAYTKEPLQVSDSEYDVILRSPVIKSLIDNGCIIVLTKYKAKGKIEVDGASERLKQLADENVKLADAQRASDARANEAEAKLKELEEKYKALEKEANDKIEELSKKQ